ncbi:MAG: DUF4926 domain-containing protein [Thermoguttaceae bacterium]|jgi:hypothetical protein
MRVQLFSRVVLTRDVPEEGLRTGDVGTVVEIYDDASGGAIGYELEMFAASGETLAVASVPADAVRPATSADRLAARAG